MNLEKERVELMEFQKNGLVSISTINRLTSSGKLSKKLVGNFRQIHQYFSFISNFTHRLRAGQEGAFTLIGKEEGIKEYWKGNLPRVIRIIPYSGAHLFVDETYKLMDWDLSVIGRLAAGAYAGMTSTFVALNMLREEGVASFYNGLGPSLIGIAPYIVTLQSSFAF
ncbi:unnamed protein product [Fraxinus pennsylvanica]|uniref:ADP,ATP carrier protein n=1 Tax=Fraxinus pennsylvanica TaxID=56036 RepID=A0AAD2A694_9LAMI|nr:unnamed protein product [Fraxinus pennsylvanica]